jgi:hypothetical protein
MHGHMNVKKKKTSRLFYKNWPVNAVRVKRNNHYLFWEAYKIRNMKHLCEQNV